MACSRIGELATGGMVSGSGNLDPGNGERISIKRQRGQIAPLWQAWELAREDASDARLGWGEAGDEDRANAYSAYVAAADREAAAADHLRAAPDDARERDRRHPPTRCPPATTKPAAQRRAAGERRAR